MSDLQNLIEKWQQVTGKSTIKDKSFINLKNNKIMDSIINYENQEKKEKEDAKWLAVIGTAAILVYFILSYYSQDVVFNSINFIGFAIMLVLLLKSLYSNRTDDFPDARVLATKEYLVKVKEDIYSRRRRHFKNALVLALYIPATFLAFYDFYAVEENTTTLNFIYMCGLGIAAIFVIIREIWWFKKYDKRTMPLKQELDELIAEIH